MMLGATAWCSGWRTVSVGLIPTLLRLFVDAVIPAYAAAFGGWRIATLLTAQVAFNKLNKFALAPSKLSFRARRLFPTGKRWSCVRDV